MTTANVILEIARIGGLVGQTDGKLRVALPDGYPAALKEHVKAHRTALLELLSCCQFSVVSAEGFGLMFWVSRPEHKATLIQYGADPGYIYSGSELELLTGRGYSFSELEVINTTKALFGGTIIRHSEPQ